MYFDYALVGTSSLEAEVEYNADGDLFIGGTTHSQYSYGGAMAHFRVSDEALTSDQFIHFTRTERAVDEPEDVVLHLDFEPVDGLSTNKTVVFNRAATGSAVHLHTADNATYAGYANFTTDVYTNMLYSSRYARAYNADIRSFNKTNGNNAYPYLAWIPDEDVFHDYSFTVEMFLKTSENSRYRPYLRRRPESSPGKVQITLGTGSTAGKLSCGFNGYRVSDPNMIGDGAWHHVALVFDNSARKLRMFRDWRQLASDVSVPEEIFTASATPITICGDPGDNSTAIAKIDDVRITKRALKKSEFFSPDRTKAFMVIVR